MPFPEFQVSSRGSRESRDFGHVLPMVSHTHRHPSKHADIRTCILSLFLRLLTPSKPTTAKKTPNQSTRNPTATATNNNTNNGNNNSTTNIHTKKKHKHASQPKSSPNKPTAATENPDHPPPSIPSLPHRHMYPPPLPVSPQSSLFFVVAAVRLRGEGPLGGAVSDAAWVTGSVYAVRCALDLWLRAPLHWGPSFDVGELFSAGGQASRVRQALGKPLPLATRPEEPPSAALATTPQPTPAPRRPDV